MHPEVEAFVKKYRWNTKSISFLEDLKQTFPQKSLEWCYWVVRKFLYPKITIRDVDSGKECFVELEIQRKILPIVDKHQWGTSEQRRDAAIAMAKEEVKEEVKEEIVELAKVLQSLLSVVRTNIVDLHNLSHMNPAKEETAPVPLRKKGRHKKVFEDFLYDDAPEGLMPVLEDMMAGASGRESLAIILAITGVYIEEPTNKSVCERFNTVGETSFGEQIAKHTGGTYGRKDFSDRADPIEESVLERIRMKIRVKLDEWAKKNNRTA